MNARKYSPSEIAERGEKLYRDSIEPTVAADNRGKFVAIDVDTAEYRIDESELRAMKALLEERPNSEIYLIRIGYPTAYRIGMASKGHR